MVHHGGLEILPRTMQTSTPSCNVKKGAIEGGSVSASTEDRLKATQRRQIVDRFNIAGTLITASTRVWRNAGGMYFWQMPHVFTSCQWATHGCVMPAANLPNSSVLSLGMLTTYVLVPPGFVDTSFRRICLSRDFLYQKPAGFC